MKKKIIEGVYLVFVKLEDCNKYIFYSTNPKLQKWAENVTKKRVVDKDIPYVIKAAKKYVVDNNIKSHQQLLAEYCEENNLKLKYGTRREGNDFAAFCYVNDVHKGTGVNPSKMSAIEDAAKHALEELQNS